MQYTVQVCCKDSLFDHNPPQEQLPPASAITESTTCSSATGNTINNILYIYQTPPKKKIYIYIYI